MAADIIQFVSAKSASPTVLLDLNDEDRWLCELISAAPALLQRASGQSMLADGSIDFGSVRTDRTVELRIDLAAPDQDTKAAELQKLARIIDRERAWLRYQPVGASLPVFLRTKRGDVTDVLNVDVTKATVRFAVVLPADPYAYGLPVTGTATVSNDPASASAFSFPMTNVRGDAAAPLLLELDPSVQLSSVMIGSTSGGVAPGVLGGSASAYAGTLPGWTKEPVSDPTAVGGSFTRVTFNGGLPEAPTAFPPALAGFGETPAGEYRVLARIRSDAINPKAAAPGQTRPTPVGSTWRWVDLGTRRLPEWSPLTSAFNPEVETGTGGVTFTVSAQTIATDAHLDLDHVIAVPVPGPDENRGATMFAAGDPVDNLVAAGPDKVLFWRDAGGAPYVGDWVYEAGEPIVVPGAQNRVYVLGWVGASEDVDTLSSTIDVAWTYHPLYWSIRPVGS